jgi:hypothetical protein
LREIAYLLAISKDSAGSAVHKLLSAGLLVKEPGAVRPHEAPHYRVVDAKDVLAARAKAGASPEIGAWVKTQRNIRVADPVSLVEDAPVSRIQDAPVPSRGRTCPDLGTPIGKKEEMNERANTRKGHPPLPPSSEGGAALPVRTKGAGESDADAAERAEFLRCKGVNSAGLREAALLMACKRVMANCMWTENRRLEAVMMAAFDLWCAKTGKTPEQAANLAIANHGIYQRDRKFMRYTWGSAKWFSEGHWCDSASWPYG